MQQQEAAANESVCISSQACNIINEDPSKTGLAEFAIKADMPVTGDVTGRATKAAKKERQQAAKYGLEKLPPITNVPEKQETFGKDLNDSVAKYTEQQSSENTSLMNSTEKYSNTVNHSSRTCTTFKATKANIDEIA